MSAPTPSDLLYTLPSLLYVWSIFSLVWGTIAGMLLYSVCKKSRACKHAIRDSDRYVLWLIAAVNIFLTWFVLTVPLSMNVSWIAIINVFYTAQLTYVSVDVSRWWKSINRCYRTRDNTFHLQP